MQYIIVKSTCKRLNAEQKQIALLVEQLIWWGSLSQYRTETVIQGLQIDIWESTTCQNIYFMEITYKHHMYVCINNYTQ
jgi:hypothetical protein